MAGPVLVLEVNHTRQLRGVNADASGLLAPGKSIAWSTDNAAVATVDQTGLVTGIGAGTCTITATAGALVNTVSVTVAARVATQVTIAVGDRT